MVCHQRPRGERLVGPRHLVVAFHADRLRPERQNVGRTRVGWRHMSPSRFHPPFDSRSRSDNPETPEMKPTNRADRIHEIIERRRPLAERISATAGRINDVSTDLEALLMLCTSLRESTLDGSHTDDLAEFVSHVDTLQKLLALRQGELEMLAERFLRQTLTIGVVGRARQGKSKFLQSITGLTSNVIPDGSGSHCTGVKSRISHHDGRFGATVYVYNEETFLAKVVAPYYERLTLGEPP